MGRGRKISRRRALALSVGAAVASSTVRAGQGSAKARPSRKPKDTPEKTGMPCGTIGDLKISRLILGSNMPGAHSRDLIYVKQLGRVYNTKARMLDMYAPAESQGINTVLQGNVTRVVVSEPLALGCLARRDLACTRPAGSDIMPAAGESGKETRHEQANRV